MNYSKLLEVEGQSLCDELNLSAIFTFQLTTDRSVILLITVVNNFNNFFKVCKKFVKNASF